MPRLHLTDIAVRALRPTDKYETYWDDTTPGFGIRVGKRSKTWTIMRGRNRERITIGKYGDLSLAEARAESKRVLAAEPQIKATSLTFAAARDTFLFENYRTTKPRTKVEATRLLKKHFKSLDSMQLAEIDDTHIKRALDKLAETTSEQLHVYRTARCFFRWATRPPHRYIKHSPMEGYEPPSVDRRGTGVANNLALTSITSGAGDGSVTATTATAYDPIGNVSTVDGPLTGTADTTRYRYDIRRQVLATVSADPDGGGSLLFRAVRNTFNPKGQITSVEVGTTTAQTDSAIDAMNVVQRTDTTYDSANRRAKTTFVVGSTAQSVAQYSYDAANRPECTAIRMNAALFGALPSNACTLGTTGSDGPDRISKIIYDHADREQIAISAYGTSVAQNTKTMTYSYNGKVQTIADANGNLTTYGYDSYDHLAQTSYPCPATGAGCIVGAPSSVGSSSGVGSSLGSDYELLTFNPTGTVHSRRLRDGSTVTYAYDNLDRETAGMLGVVTGYDNFDRVISRALPSQSALTYGYDALGRQTSETNPNPSTSITRTFDPAGRMTHVTAAGYTIDYDYDVLGAMTAVREANVSTGVGVLATYAYDNLGRRWSLTRAGGAGVTTTYTYDSSNQLSGFDLNLNGTMNDQSLTFSRNLAGQIIARSSSNGLYDPLPRATIATGALQYNPNGLNQLTTNGATTLTYDARGNLSSEMIGATTLNSYGYDLANHLTSVSGATLAYDAAGRLSSVTAGATTTRFAYDASRLIAEYDGTTGALQRRYVHGGATDEPLVWYEGTGTTTRQWLVVNQQGSIIVVADGSAVPVVIGGSSAINVYDEYGVPRTGNKGRFQYTGQAWIPEGSLYYYKARMYSPTLGRFLQTDPIGMKDDLNLYNYVADDPVNRIDPTGLAGCATKSSVNGRKLTQAECDHWKEKQVQGKKDVEKTREALAAYNADYNSAAGKAFAAAMTAALGKGALSTDNLKRLSSTLNSLEKFFNDPGTAKGGKYDVYANDQWGNGGFNSKAGEVIYGSKFFELGNTSLSRNNTIHEPLHRFGFGDRSTQFPDGRYYIPSDPYWDKRFPSTENADNWACVISQSCK